MAEESLLPIRAENQPCIVLIGMAASGKSTIGQILAKDLGWAYLDSDYLLESLYGCQLQNLADALSKEKFLDLEAGLIKELRPSRTVIASGGSVVYRESAMSHLAGLGPLVHLDAPFHEIERRIARNPQRGLAIGPGQSLEDLFLERKALYRRWATLCCRTKGRTAAQCAAWICQKLKQKLVLTPRP